MMIVLVLMISADFPYHSVFIYRIDFGCGTYMYAIDASIVVIFYAIFNFQCFSENRIDILLPGNSNVT